MADVGQKDGQSEEMAKTEDSDTKGPVNAACDKFAKSHYTTGISWGKRHWHFICKRMSV